MNNTFQIILNWDRGTAFAERMSSKILDVEGYERIDLQSPMGGSDGGKDIICYKDDKKFVAGCYFPNGQKDFTKIERKFDSDYKGVEKNDGDAFIFLTNQKITPSERIKLCEKFENSDIYHGERVCNILDSPKGYGIRLEYLDIELSKSEQIAHLDYHVDLKKDFEEIKGLLHSINKVSSRLEGQLLQRDIDPNKKLTTLSISGVVFSSRISIEDLLSIQQATLYESDSRLEEKTNDHLLGFRNVEIWIGSPGGSKDDAVFTPPEPSEVPKLTIELLEWWRSKYMEIAHQDREMKIEAIATFHERFLTIHPFLDGNGRVARVLSSIQFKDLIGDKIKFESINDISQYYEALQNARNGNSQDLVNIFMALTK